MFICGRSQSKRDGMKLSDWGLFKIEKRGREDDRRGARRRRFTRRPGDVVPAAGDAGEPGEIELAQELFEGEEKQVASSKGIKKEGERSR